MHEEMRKERVSSLQELSALKAGALKGSRLPTLICTLCPVFFKEEQGVDL